MCSIVLIFAVLYRVGVNISIVLQWRNSIKAGMNWHKIEHTPNEQSSITKGNYSTSYKVTKINNNRHLGNFCHKAFTDSEIFASHMKGHSSPEMVENPEVGLGCARFPEVFCVNSRAL